MTEVDVYSIRRAQVGDLKHLAAIEQAASQRFLGTPFAHLARGATLDSAVLQDAIEDDWLFVACAANAQRVGFALCGTLTQGAVGGDAWLREVDVVPEHSRRGLGRRLIERVADCARQRGFRRLILTTFESLPWNAPMYERLGFRPWPTYALTPEWLELRQQETAAGLDPRQRVVLALPLG